jgi:hypothetical protein
MNNTKEGPLEPFSQYPKLMKANFARILEAYWKAPADRKGQAVTEVLRQIRGEQSA